MSGQGKIGALWREFMTRRVRDQIPAKRDARTLAIYYHYESDANALPWRLR